MSRATRIVTMWIGHHKVRVSLHGDADADPDLAVRLEVALGRLMHAGASHLVVHLDQLTGDDSTIVDLLARTCQRLWLRRGVMEVVGMRDVGRARGMRPTRSTRSGTQVVSLRGRPHPTSDPDLSGSHARTSACSMAAAGPAPPTPDDRHRGRVTEPPLTTSGIVGPLNLSSSDS